MRLIDADKLMGELHESLKDDCDLRKDYEFMGIDEFIENQPTAYNVDKVLEQLEYKVKEYDERIEKRKGPTFFDETERIKQFDERAWGIEIAIEIVKGGGIDER